MYRKLYNLLFLFLYTCISIPAFSQLVVTTAQPASVLASTLAGPGVTILSPTLSCPGVANGTFTATGTLLAMSNGIVLTNGHAAACVGPYGPPPGTASFNDGAIGDPAMVPYTGTTTYDACILQFDIVAAGDSIGFNYQFGSQEYYSAVCSDYNDAFAFFISGPGITGAPDIALVPGTNIPVEINTVNDGIPGSSGGSLSNCTSLGAGSPFTAYYLDNTGGTYLSYKGFTTKFRAVQAVTPCDTYHIKLSIVDGGNPTYDSGVFLEAASLTTNSYAFNHADSIGATINGIPNAIVRGCSPAVVNITASHPNTVAQVLNLSFGGAAVNGVDVTDIPNTITLPADSTSVGINVQALVTAAGGAGQFIIYLNGPCTILDSIAINIMDSPSASILTTNDTTICLGSSFQMMVTGTPGLTYSWIPPAGLSDPTIMEPVCTPAVSTVYTMIAQLPGSGCAAMTENLAVNVNNVAVNILTDDTAICYGSSLGILVSGTPVATYSWSPAGGLSNAGIEAPIATPSTTTTYTLTASVSGGCIASDTVTITVDNPNVTILTPDTSVCAGISFDIRVSGDAALTYSWSPAGSLDNPTVMQPVATPYTPTVYMLTTTYPGSSCVANTSFSVSIIQIEATASALLQGCNTGLNLSSGPGGSNYSYLWNGPSGYVSYLQNPDRVSPTSADSGLYTVTVTDNDNGCSAQAVTSVTIHPISYTALSNVTPNQTIAYGTSVRLNADNANLYWWMPSDGSLSDRNINDPIATPLQNTTYTVYGADSLGCIDSATITIDVTYDSISIPSAFTPNNDGLNDVFRPVGMKYQKLVEFNVYNRWGQAVFTTTNKEQGWDGTFNGVPQDIGVYNYVIIVALEDGNNSFYKGSVTLLR